MATAQKAKMEPQKDSGTSFQSQNPDVTSSDLKTFLQRMGDAQLSTQEQMKYTQTVLGKMVEVTNNLSIITTKMLDKNAPDGSVKNQFRDDDRDNYDPRIVTIDDSSPQQQRFKQSYPKLRPIN